MWIFFCPISGLNFGRWILRDEFLEGEFFWGPLLLEKTGSKNSTQEFGRPKFGRPKFVSQNSGPNSGFGGAKSPVQKIVPEKASMRPTNLTRARNISAMREALFGHERTPQHPSAWHPYRTLQTPTCNNCSGNKITSWVFKVGALLWNEIWPIWRILAKISGKFWRILAEIWRILAELRSGEWIWLIFGMSVWVISV